MEKYVYIKKSQSGKFLEFTEMFDENLFDNLGDSWESYEAGMWVLLSPEQVAFHTEHPEATVKEVWDMKIEPKPEPEVAPEPEEKEPEEEESEEEPVRETVLERKLREITEYTDPCSFELDGKEVWLNSQERRETLDQITAYRSVGEKNLTKWIDGTEYTFTLSKWLKIVRRAEVFASKIENVKNTHKKNVKELQSDLEIENYDYTTGYPEKPNFEDL